MIRYFRTYWKLGLKNISMVAIYRISLKLRIHPVQYIQSSIPDGPFYRLIETHSEMPQSNTSWRDKVVYFDKFERPVPTLPVPWFLNIFTQKLHRFIDQHWWKIPDFSDGDIKVLWELSRFNWALIWATDAANGNRDALKNLNSWVHDWAIHNPPYKGPNWKCGQEASIRVIHLITAAWLLQQDKEPEAGLIELIQTHLQRIYPTTPYAFAQQNNHGTTEAAALFIGGLFLRSYDSRAEYWAQHGRKLLENRAKCLIQEDGTFSQYSVNYHRLMLDTYSIVEAWRLRFNQPPFTADLISRLSLATTWLFNLVDPNTGHAPNIGANDGARILPIVDCNYLDFRPSVQLASALFNNCKAYELDDKTNSLLKWLQVDERTTRVHPESCSYTHGGFHVLRSHRNMVVMRYPKYNFRPGHADALHVDFWLDGINILRDAGSFSYNSKYSEWFAGTYANNTVEFDGRDQMPRISRFLFDNWSKTTEVGTVAQCEDRVSAFASYIDYLGARHYRKIILEENSFTCLDKLGGRFNQACLRWRLAPFEWRASDNEFISDKCSIKIEVDGVESLPKLGTTFESQFYHHKTSIPELTLKLKKVNTIKTIIRF